MTVKKNFKNLKDRLKDDTLDLSLSDLEEVPVQEIAAVKKASHLDLSNNLLTILPKNFVILKQIVRLDLSKNMLTEIPENFGEMTQLKYLDLYANQISRLPLSLSELKNLRWLDLKENPLTPAVASVAGPCSNADECKACARNVVEYLSNVKLTIGEEKLRRMNVVAGGDVPSSKNTDLMKKETKKKKKKKQTDKEHDKNVEKTERQVQNETSQCLKNKTIVSVEPSQSPKTKQCVSAALCGVLTSIFLWSILLVLLFLSLIIFLPLYDKELSHVLSDYIEKHTGILIETYQRYGMDTLQFAGQIASTWLSHVYKVVNDIYNSTISKST